MSDLLYALQAIRRMPALAAVVVLSLGAGIGVNAAVFSWMQAVVVNPIPGVKGSGSFHFLEPRSETGAYPGTSWREFQDLAQLKAAPDLFAFRIVAFNVGAADRIERTFGVLASGNYFDALGLRPALGRFFRPDEVSRPGAAPVAVISYEYWRVHFAGREDVIGRQLRVNGSDVTIVGVAPRRFQGTIIGLAFDLWTPATMAPVLLPGSRELDDRTSRGYLLVGKLGARVTREQAQAEVNAAMKRLAEIYPESNGALQAEVLPFWWAPRGPQRLLVRALTLLQLILLLLLVAICGNTANLMLARASVRQREMAVRLALGAGRWRIARLLLVENVLLGLGGAAIGVGIAMWGTEAMRAMPMYGALPVKFQTTVDAGTLAFAACLGVACGLVFGLAPAIQLGRVDPQSALRSGLAGAARSRLRHTLMAVEVCLASIVLIAAAIFLKNFSDTRALDPGFRREGVLLAAYDLSSRNPDGQTSRAFATRLLDRLREAPGVEAVAVATSVPLDIHGLPLRSFTVEGHARSDGRDDESLVNTVTPDYFKVLDIALVSGSGFAPLNEPSAPPQAVVNEEFVRRHLDRIDPIGRRISSRGRTYTISGVVRNSTYDAFGEAAQPVIYFSYRDRPAATGEIHLRARAGAETAVVAALRDAVRELDATLPLYNVRTMPEHIEKNLFLRRIPARMFAVLGPLLLMLAAIGIYAVVSYTVAQRTTEIGVRMALGATSNRVVRQIVVDSLKVVCIGAVLGWAIVFDVVHQMSPDAPLDKVVFLGVPALLLAVAGVACWIPAMRASKIEPVIAMRQ